MKENLQMYPVWTSRGLHPVTVTTDHQLFMFPEALMVAAKQAMLVDTPGSRKVAGWCQGMLDAVSGDADMHAFLAGCRREAQKDAQDMLDSQVIVYTTSGYEFFDHFVDTCHAEIAAIMVHTETYEVYDELCRHLGTFVRKPRSDEGFITDFRPGVDYP